MPKPFSRLSEEESVKQKTGSKLIFRAESRPKYMEFVENASLLSLFFD